MPEDESDKIFNLFGADHPDLDLTKDKAVTQVSAFLQSVVNIVLRNGGIWQEDIEKSFQLREDIELILSRYITEETLMDLHKLTETHYNLTSLVSPGNWFVIAHKKSTKEIAWMVIALMIQNLYIEQTLKNMVDKNDVLE